MPSRSSGGCGVAEQCHARIDFFVGVLDGLDQLVGLYRHRHVSDDLPKRNGPRPSMGAAHFVERDHREAR